MKRDKFSRETRHQIAVRKRDNSRANAGTPLPTGEDLRRPGRVEWQLRDLSDGGKR